MAATSNMHIWSALSASRSQNHTHTLNSAIRAFLSELELTDRQATTVAERQGGVRKRINETAIFPIERDFLTGSYARDTQIRPLPNLQSLLTSQNALDVDSITVVKVTDYTLQRYWNVGDGGTRLLQDLERTLKGHLGLTVVIDRPSVTVKWSGGMKMEVTPAFDRKGGGLFIPSSDGTTNWQHTDPEADATALTALNKSCNNELIPMIKMLKCWNRTHGKPYRSFAIETAAYHSAGQGTWQGFRHEIPHFFNNLANWSGQRINPPSGQGAPLQLPIVPAFVSTHRTAVMGAYFHDDHYRHTEAVRLMGQVFGKPFPGA